MIKTIKTITVLFGISILISNTSCTMDEIQTERTKDIELSELNDAITSIEAEGFNVDTTALGVYYIVHDEGIDSLPLVTEGDTCFLEYEGHLLDGTLFDASAINFEDSIWQFVYGEISLISGFEDGISLMKKGSEIDLLIPSDLAYGETDLGLIPPYSSLLFYTRMHDIRPKIE